MSKKFNRIGLVSHSCQQKALDTCEKLYDWLKAEGYEVIAEQQVAESLALTGDETGSLAGIGQQADLAIVVGGDGNMLRAARTLAEYDIKVIGVNRGNLGFLTDLKPDDAIEQLSEVLKGNYSNEQRFLLEAAQVCQSGKVNTAMNEVVLYSRGRGAMVMIEFEVYIDNHLAFSQFSEGLIIATPTGSTAYSLSAGGPILTPTLNDAMVLVPMFPHTLSARPLVTNSHSTIRLKFPQTRNDLEIKCDNQIALPIEKNSNGEKEVLIQRSKHCLNLIHPREYNYFETLRNKLGWSKKLF